MGPTVAGLVVAQTVSEPVEPAQTVSELVVAARRPPAVAGVQPDVVRPCTQRALRRVPVECTRHSGPGKLVGYTLSGIRRRSDQQPSSRVERSQRAALAHTRRKTSRMGCICKCFCFKSFRLEGNCFLLKLKESYSMRLSPFTGATEVAGTGTLPIY